MTVRMVLMTTSGQASMADIDGPESAILRRMYELLNCEFIEAISGMIDEQPIVMYFDEYGKQHDLPANPGATMIGHRWGMAPSDYVVGDVLLASVGPGGATLSVPEDVATGLCKKTEEKEDGNN